MKTLIKRLCVAALIAGGGLLPLGRVAAQTFTNLHNFDSGVTDGGVPGAIIISNNVLYGTSFFGGKANNGTVFKLNSDGTGYTNLYSFSSDFPGFTNSDGVNPGGGYVENSALVLSGSTLYGTAFYGGKFGGGTVFKINVDGTGFTNLHNFAGSDGTTPNAGLILSGDMLYGAAANGAAAGLGTIFKLTTNGTGFTVLHEFSNTAGDNYTNSDGGQPVGGLLLSGGTLYGTTQVGGTLGCGTLFALSTNGGTSFTNLHNFDINAANPSGTLILSGSILYGTAYSVVFAINTNGSGYTNLFTFEATSINSPFTNGTGNNPSGGLILSGNALYGTASGGGRFGNGTVFAVNTNGTGFVNLFDFPGPSGVPPNIINDAGAIPSGGLVLSGNTLYGTADAGGQSGYGTVFSLTLPVPPPLTIVRSGANVVLTWPTNGLGFTLQATTNLTANAWSIVSPAQTVSGTNYVVTNAISGSTRFYQLGRP